MIVESYSSVGLTTSDLARARWFWVDQLEFAVADEDAGRYFVVDVGTLRLRVDLADGNVYRAGSTDPVIRLRVASLANTLAALAARDVHPTRGLVEAPDGAFAELLDPDGRTIILAESD